MNTIPLSNDYEALLDDDDFERLSRFHWCYRGERNGAQGYAIRHAKVDDKYKTVYLHREVMNPPPGHEVVFRNHDRLDCRRENLLVVTKQEARRHHRVRRDSRTGLKGIRFNSSSRKWTALFYRNGNCLCLGTFDTQEAAMSAYQKAANGEQSDSPAAPQSAGNALMSEPAQQT